MAASIILGFDAIRRGDVARHRDWMARAYALALGAGTQVFTLGIGNAVFGTSELNTALMLGAGWGINLAVVEYVIRARSRASVRARTPASVNDGPVVRCLVAGSFQPFLEALRGQEVVTLRSTPAVESMSSTRVEGDH